MTGTATAQKPTRLERIQADILLAIEHHDRVAIDLAEGGASVRWRALAQICPRPAVIGYGGLVLVIAAATMWQLNDGAAATLTALMAALMAMAANRTEPFFAFFLRIGCPKARRPGRLSCGLRREMGLYLSGQLAMANHSSLMILADKIDDGQINGLTQIHLAGLLRAHNERSDAQWSGCQCNNGGLADLVRAFHPGGACR